MFKFLKPKEAAAVGDSNSPEHEGEGSGSMDRREFITSIGSLALGALASSAVRGVSATEALKDKLHNRILLARSKWYKAGKEAIIKQGQQLNLPEIVRSLDARGVYWVPDYPHEEVLYNLADAALGFYEVASPDINVTSYSEIVRALNVLKIEVAKYPDGFFREMFGVPWYVCLARNIKFHGTSILDGNKEPRPLLVNGLARILPQRYLFLPAQYSPVIAIRLKPLKFSDDGMHRPADDGYFPYVFHHEVFHGFYNIMVGAGPAIDYLNPGRIEAAFAFGDTARVISEAWDKLLPPLENCRSYHYQTTRSYDPTNFANDHVCGYSSYSEPYGTINRSEDMATIFGWLMTGKEPSLRAKRDPYLDRKMEFIKSLVNEWTRGSMDQDFWLRIARF